MRYLTILLGCLALALPCQAQTPSWTQLKPTTQPPGRLSPAMTYDSARQRTVLFGGIVTFPAADTWEWNGKNWTELEPSTRPPHRRGHPMAYDADRQRTVLFGGYGVNGLLGDTWEWDGKNWTKFGPTTSPATRGGPAMAYDTARRRTVLFGGYRGIWLADTWEWNGKNWTEVTPVKSPPGRLFHAMAYDSCRRRLVLFGGSGGASAPYLGDTWEWDGESWREMKPAASPTARYSHAMAYDSARQRVVLFGGVTGQPASALGDTWEWDGTNWTQIKLKNTPPARQAHAMAYDSGRRRTVLFGGVNSGPFLTDTWEYSGPVPALVADTWTVSIGTGGTQKLFLDAGATHAARLYWVFGSVTGTTPGITLASAIGAVHISLNPDIWTDYTIALPNTATLANTKATLDASGTAQAAFNIPKVNLPSGIGLVFHHAYLVYDQNNNFYMASNAVPLKLVK